MRNKILIFLLLLSLFALSFNTVFAKDTKETSDSDIPERDGVYDVQGRPDLKVRVFVHYPKESRFSPTPSLNCNWTDPNSTATVSATGWHLPGSWTYQLNTSSAPSSVGSSNLPTFAKDAFDQWASASANKVTFTKGIDTTVSQKGLDGKNIIAWGRTSGTALAVTYTWYYPSSGLVAEVDTIMNKKFPWSWTPYAPGACVDQNSYDAQDILTHELGHWMGLDDQYDSINFADATMYGYGAKGEIKKDTLTTGDTNGISAIYSRY